VIYNEGKDEEILQIENWDKDEKRDAERVIRENLRKKNELNKERHEWK
jgi:hypothetical protein